MSMRVMHIGDVRVGVRQGLMAMRVDMRLARRIVGAVLMPMVFVMNVRVGVCLPRMHMRVLVTLGEM